MQNFEGVQISIVGGEIESSFHADQSLLWAQLSKINISGVTGRQNGISTKIFVKLLHQTT